MGMSYLLDTHILLWWLFNDSQLNQECRDIIRNSNHNILVSSASAWEIATKYRIGRLPEAKPFVELLRSTSHNVLIIFNNYSRQRKPFSFFSLPSKLTVSVQPA
jgi:PIN domain nuclease of toxin-antitoxin system